MILRLALIALALALPAHAETKLGVVSYWGPKAAPYEDIPAGAIALINPDSGIFTAWRQTREATPKTASYRRIAGDGAKRGVDMLGYVPTGYFNHDCDVHGECQTWDRIERQVETYFRAMPGLKGIFFDEAAPSAWDCAAFTPEYERLREIVVKYRPDTLIAFNPGLPSPCAIDAAKAGEVVVTFEQDMTAYAAQSDEIHANAQAATAKGVKTWHMIHTVRDAADMPGVVAAARAHGADYVYVTNIGGDWQKGENTWGSPPAFWSELVSELAK
ncbi:hypothetical protein ABAC460_07380 [Asticcacaulis sp. AC460]|uniref:spherulation-specific family 4 protein n=1 Tax=Asticcacaulis sp. AC460 TaxID=1282360 RepID=UPI0003C3C57F|nr:spherulation-specific family 4 protein [Asticcacaulis sp. AC460]ESQ91045.1 hypothetical protein ABAC460_07380 [Asticcacaulis sp. AC460]